MIVLECLFLTIAPCDAAEPWQLGSQDAATPMMQGIIDLHHDIFFFLILIFVFVSWILVRALWHFHYKKNPIPQRIVHGTTIEILWTIFPSIILMFIAIPSFALLYSMDEVVVDPAITIKAIGHQWYWTYEYSDYNSSDEQSLTFDSYTIPEDDPELGQSRLLEVDNRVVVPEKTHLRIIVTPADVPHSWAVPSLGVKCDAVPGRLNQTSISVQREGVYYGQCSEICGRGSLSAHERRRVEVKAPGIIEVCKSIFKVLLRRLEVIIFHELLVPAYCDTHPENSIPSSPFPLGEENIPPQQQAPEPAASEDSLSWGDLLRSSTEEAPTSEPRGPNSAEPATPVASPEEAGSPPAGNDYPYPDNEVIGGDSVNAIQSRLLANNPSPSFEEIERARIDAQDRFEVKVEIIRQMAPLDPEGDWEGRGARALDNPHTSTGEPSLEQLYRLQDALNQDGIQSEAFRLLKSKAFTRREEMDAHSEG
nr:cytochrome c oxidase subunit 2 [Markhamia cauda-felina]